MGADLITLEEYKTSEKIEGLKDDSKLASLISSVSQLVKTYCANTFVDYVTTDKSEIHSLPWQSEIIQTRESPLISVSLVEERASPGNEYTTLVADDDYFVDTTTDTIYRISSTGFAYWPTGPGAVKITYRAGYSEVPSDLKLAVIDMVRYYHKEEYKTNRAFAGVSVTNEPSSTQWRNVSFPDHIKRVLDLHKTVVM